MNEISPDRASRDRDESWHLGRTADERVLAGFEFSLERAMHAYFRWKSACMAVAAGDELSGNDTSILNIIRMKDRPKGLSEIGRLLNREDTPNIQYSIRKLLRAGLIEKAEAGSRKATSYRATEHGRAVTDAYAELRETLLLPLTGSVTGKIEDYAAAERFLTMMAGVYDQAAKLSTRERY